MALTPQAFIAKWQNSPIKERAGAQAHFLDLCRMLDEPEPADVDPTGNDYGFEVGATKTTGGNGFADVFKRGHFGWEYKGTKANLDDAFAQLQRYAVALDNPPLLIVSDIGTTIRIHTNWTNSVSKRYDIAIADLADPVKRGWLKSALSDPEALRPTKTRQELTEEVAGEFAVLARSLRMRGHKAEEVAHFINRLVFCMFAEDVKLLPEGMFTRMLDQALDNPSEFEDFARELFAAMTKGGRVGFERVKWFNGGLFDGDLVFNLTYDEVKIVRKAAGHYWGDVDPSILGTLFERGLDPDKRSQLGAHYTDREKIMMIIDPVIVGPLKAEWDTAKAEISALMDRATAADQAAKTLKGRQGAARSGQATLAIAQAQQVLDRYLKRLADYRVLDPACGSGNFLYLALNAMKDLEHRVHVEAEALGLPRQFPQIGPEVVKGIEINPYAAELARVSVWIGEIQWMLRNGFSATENPILKPLDNIECRDALLTWKPATGVAEGIWVEATWPEADAIIGNPPFLGGKKLKPQLGAAYIGHLRRNYRGKVPNGADLVCSWFAKARQAILNGRAARVGLVATQAITSGVSRRVLDTISEDLIIYNAWSDEPWTVDGAAVRVSLICFSKSITEVHLNGRPVLGIYADLTPITGSGSVDLTKAKPLEANRNVCFQGIIPRSSLNKKDALRLGLPPASFLVDELKARTMLAAPVNPNGRHNTDVLKPYMIGDDITGRPTPRFIVDFFGMSEREAALYEAPFSHALPIKLHRAEMAQESALLTWWTHWNPRPTMRAALQGMERYIATSRVSKHRTFVFVPAFTLPDSRLAVVARDDLTTLGILQSSIHVAWSLATGAIHGDGKDGGRPTYNGPVCFETFPFPDGLTPNTPAPAFASDPRAVAISAAAKELVELRDKWLNPADLVRIEGDIPGYPPRIIPTSEDAGRELRKRTLTNLYNENPTWLQHATSALDEAVAAAYGWPADLSDADVLARLFGLNQQRVAIEAMKQAALARPQGRGKAVAG